MNHPSKYRRKRDGTTRLLARAAVSKSAGSLGDLLLGDGNDVDGDRVELENENVRVVIARMAKSKLTPIDLRRSFVSWSTSRVPFSLFWVKSRAETSGTY